MTETIEKLTLERLAWLTAEFATAFSKLGWDRPEGYFQHCFEAQVQEEIVFLLARRDEELLGFLKIMWQPEYTPFQEQGIPEISDLIVTPANRRQGVATRLMDRAEAIIRARNPIAGLGVGLHPGYTAAQRMYVRRGYVPDGHPLTYHNEFVVERQEVRLDDELILHLVKEL
jgi:GNAT superfamily N-acetyltransferase